MNMEQRAQYMAEIQKLEGLLAYAVAHGDKAEEERIRAQLVKMVEVMSLSVSRYSRFASAQPAQSQLSRSGKTTYFSQSSMSSKRAPVSMAPPTSFSKTQSQPKISLPPYSPA